MTKTLVYFFHEAGLQDEPLDLWDIGCDLFYIVGETDIFDFCSLFESDFCSLDCEFSRELDGVA